MHKSITIRYGLEPAFKRWFRDLWTESDREMAPWVAVILLGAAIAFGPHWLLRIVALLPVEELGNSGASVKAHQIILTIATTLAIAVILFTIHKFRKPNAICFNQHGITPLWQFLFIEFRGKTLPWSEIKVINLQKPADTRDPRNYLLCFANETATRKLVIQLGQIDEQRVEDTRRAEVFDAITEYAQNALIAPEIADILAPKRTLDFTEIWLNALSAPPGRNKLLPVNEGALLDSRYRIIKRLGAGGQGTVYLANDTESADEKVVLKETILSVYADLIVRKQALAAFHKEALALESLQHDHIVKFKRSFVDDHRAYLVLQFIDGITLSEKVKNDGALSALDAVAYASQIADILAALHESTPPLVHRDLTPDNLMVAKDGKLVLIDFAVAVSGKADGDEEASEDVAGKAAYMAPEQFQGKPGIHSDLYSLGGVLFFMLTANHPEPLASSSPLLLDSSISQELNTIVMKSTAYRSEDRYNSASEFKNALVNLK